MFGMKEIASIGVDLSLPLTEEKKAHARASMRSQLEALGASEQAIDEALGRLDTLFGNWSVAGVVALKLEALASLVEKRITTLNAAGEEVTKTAQDIEERADHVFECGRANACINFACAAMAMAVETLREVAKEQRDDKPVAVGDA
jgi:biotin-(acetyl-CoA carboxylase) ligase